MCLCHEPTLPPFFSFLGPKKCLKGKDDLLGRYPSFHVSSFTFDELRMVKKFVQCAVNFFVLFAVQKPAAYSVFSKYNLWYFLLK